MSFLDNTRHPTGLGGRMMVSLMNVGHRALADWGLRLLDIPADAAVLDCGCGGGANLARLLKKCPAGMVGGHKKVISYFLRSGVTSVTPFPVSAVLPRG